MALQKEWGKPIKLGAKENPLGMSVYKTSGKDGRGAWFARRSVHEGLGFRKWKLGLQQEFPESLASQGGPGDGNIRGIGGERRVERREVEGVGTVEGEIFDFESAVIGGFSAVVCFLTWGFTVYHLSAQFPGPTTPRDFVTLLLTSSSALEDALPTSQSSDAKRAKFKDRPRHFMVISRPCDHPDCPPRDGYIRGQYESVEFIREMPRARDRKSMSATDLVSTIMTEESTTALEKEAILRNAIKKAKSTGDEEILDETPLTPEVKEHVVREGRQRGKTISFAGTRGASAKGERHDNPITDEDDESNPVEWIMITRSDPGGSVPRFMVERGTPGGIVADASKFLDWACKKEHPEDEVEALETGDTEHIKAKKQEALHAAELNGHSAGVGGFNGSEGMESQDPPMAAVKAVPEAIVHPDTMSSSGLLDSVAKAAYASLETYAPQAVLDRLSGHSPSPSMSASIPSLKSGNDKSIVNGIPKSSPRSASVSSISSVGSFASAEDHFEGAEDTLSTTSSQTPSKDKKAMSPHEKALASLDERKRLLKDKLNKAREKETKDKEELTSKEQERVRKAEEKHAQEVAKQEEKYKKEIARLEAKRRKEAAKVEERKKRAEDKDEKAKLTREKEEMRQQLEVATQERDLLKEQVGALQKENTLLVVKMGKMEEGGLGGRDALKDVAAEMQGRSRSGSLRKEKEKEKGKDATVLAGNGMRKENMDPVKR